MKSYKKKITVIAIFAGLALAAFTGCSGGKESSVDEAVLKQPMQFSYGNDKYDENSSSPDYNGEDPTAPTGNNSSESSEGDSSTAGDEDYEVIEVTDENGLNIMEYVPVLDENGEPVTEYQTVTDAAGEPVTDSSGETVTTAVQVTTGVNKTETKKTSGNSGNSTTTTETVDPTSNGDTKPTSNSDTYVPYTDTASAIWLDISNKKDYIFEDEFIEVTFKIKDTTPDGVYDIVISSPDFANYDTHGVKPGKLVNGKVFVSTEAEKQEDNSAYDGFLVSADYVSCKQGDEVTVFFRMQNNPGMCAMAFCFDYDRNAMEIVECLTAGTFADIERGVSFN